MHNLSRVGRVLGAGVLLAVLCAGGGGVRAQTTNSAAQQGATVMTTPTAEVPLGPQGRRYTQTFPVFGGTAPYTFEVMGKLPEGMRWTQAENGLLLDGVPLVTGDFPLTVVVRDALGQQSSRDYVLNVTPHDTGSSVNISLSESVTTKDAVAVLPPVKITVAEGISTMDSVVIVPAVVKITVVESVKTSDAVAFLPAFVKIAVAEGVSIRDADAVLPPIKIAVSESVGIADTIAFLPAFVKIAVSESVKTTDVFSSLPTVVKIAVSEAIQTADVVAVTPQTSSTPASQTIYVGTLPTPVFGGAPFRVSATASSGLPVTIAYVSGPATGSGSGPYTATGAGVVNFTATQAGNGSYAAAAPVNFSVTVGAASQTINLGTLPMPTFGGAPFSVSATSTSGLTVTIAYVSGPATGSGSGPYTATGGGVVNFTATQAGNANYAAATPVNFSVTIAPASQTINVGTLPMPTYGGSPFSVSATATSGLPVTIAYVSGPATGSGSGPYTATGGGVVNFTATQAGNANYAAAAPVNFSVTIAPEAQTINVGTLPTPVYGGAPFSVSATASSGLPVTIAYVSGPATGAGGGPYTATGAGTVNFTATQAGNASYLAATPVNFSVGVAKQASVTAVIANPTSVTPVQTTTLTATVSAAVTGSPTGTVTFFDNGVPIGTAVPVVGGQAQLTTLLLSGSQAISATYSGDANFVGSSSTANAMVSVAPLDFTMAPVSPVSLNVVPGAAAVVSFNVTPLYPIYPGPVTFSVTGLPSSATYTITPTSVAANGGPQTVTVTIQTAAATVRNSMPTRGGPIALAMFLPLLALGALRRRKRWLSVLVLVLGVFASSAVVGCGTNSGNGFFGQSPQTYPVVITATSGTVQHTINVSLVVQ
jgi:hypothetical protein